MTLLAILTLLIGGSGVVSLLWRVIDRALTGRQKDEALTTRIANESLEAIAPILDQLRARNVELENELREYRKKAPPKEIT